MFPFYFCVLFQQSCFTIITPEKFYKKTFFSVCVYIYYVVRTDTHDTNWHHDIKRTVDTGYWNRKNRCLRKNWYYSSGTDKRYVPRSVTVFMFTCSVEKVHMRHGQQVVKNLNSWSKCSALSTGQKSGQKSCLDVIIDANKPLCKRCHCGIQTSAGNTMSTREPRDRRQTSEDFKVSSVSFYKTHKKHPLSVLLILFLLSLL